MTPSPNPPTVREHAEAIREALRNAEYRPPDGIDEHAQAILDALNAADTWYRDQHHYEHGGWGQVRLHSNDEAARLVPDPAPRPSDAPEQA